VVGAMIQYFYDGKFEQTLDAAYAFESERKSGDGGSLLMLESAFDLNTPVGERAFFDMLLYKKAPNINCITEDFIQKRRYRKPEKMEFLNSMLDSKAGLFEITGTDIDEGYAYLKEVFTGLEYKIVDIGLSGNRNNDEIYIYTRIITYNGINFGTGLNFVFSKTDSFPVGYNRNKSRNPHRIKVS
jgi:hypothetical protein